MLPSINGVFAPGDLSVAKVEDLAGKTVGVTRGAVEDLELTEDRVCRCHDQALRG